MAERVRGLVTDLGTDVSALVNAACVRPVSFAGLLLAESGLREHATRERGGCDYSYGLAQQSVCFVDEAVPGLVPAYDRALTYAYNGWRVAVVPTEVNRAACQRWYWEPENAIRNAARRWNVHVTNAVAALGPESEHVGLLACCWWNAPNLGGVSRAASARYWLSPDLAALDAAHERNREHYRSSLATAEQWREPPQEGVEMPGETELERIQRLEDQVSFLVDLNARLLSGRWHDGAGSAEALLRTIAPAKYGTFEAAAFPGTATPLPGTTPGGVYPLWIGALYYTSARAADMSGNPNPPQVDPVALVIHTMAGTLAGCDAHFNDPRLPRSQQASAHYGVGLAGTAHQYVKLTDTAWANGRLEPGEHWTARFGPGNPNPKTVAIETEDRADPATPVSDAMYSAVVELGRLAIARYPTIGTLATHRAISPQTRPNCPGDRWIASGRFAQLAADLGLATLL